MLTYKQYLDKAYGCWLGKCVAGTIGAPYEGMKQLLHLSFRSEMIEKMLPNDDLDLQVLWLKVLEEKGIYTTGDDLAAAFSEYNVFWPGEYAWFKKNYDRGLRPPYTAKYENTFYNEGMGCPIRAEIWGLIVPGNPAIAADLCVMDGTLCSNMRVAAVGALAADLLAKKDAESIGFIGAGEQAKMHLLGMKTVRPNLKVCRVAAKTKDDERIFVESLKPLLPDVEFTVCNTVLEDAIRDSDIIVTATSAQAPLLKPEWIKKGAFYSHVGGYECDYGNGILYYELILYGNELHNGFASRCIWS